jgi:hypothetical protein
MPTKEWNSCLTTLGELMNNSLDEKFARKFMEQPCGVSLSISQDTIESRLDNLESEVRALADTVRTLTLELQLRSLGIRDVKRLPEVK